MIRINTELVSYIAELQQKKGSSMIRKEIFHPKELVVAANQRLFNVYIIKSGIAKCYLTEDTGKDFIQEFFGEGEIFGEVEMFNNESSFCSVEAITDLSVFKISFESFAQLLKEDKKANQLLFKAMASKIKYKALRHAHNQTHPIETNLLRLQQQFPELHHLVSKKDIANYIGVTERSLNRVLKAQK